MHFDFSFFYVSKYHLKIPLKMERKHQINVTIPRFMNTDVYE